MRPSGENAMPRNAAGCTSVWSILPVCAIHHLDALLAIAVQQHQHLPAVRRQRHRERHGAEVRRRAGRIERAPRGKTSRRVERGGVRARIGDRRAGTRRSAGAMRRRLRTNGTNGAREPRTEQRREVWKGTLSMYGHARRTTTVRDGVRPTLAPVRMVDASWPLAAGSGGPSRRVGQSLSSACATRSHPITPAVLALNNGATPHVNELSRERVRLDRIARRLLSRRGGRTGDRWPSPSRSVQASGTGA